MPRLQVVFEESKAQDKVRGLKQDCWGLEGKRPMVP